jgi:hypothetical protein
MTERVELERRNERTLHELAILQARYHRASDPAQRFIGFLRAALAKGIAHVADRRGAVPESPVAWGWRLKKSRRGWVPQGTRIGWLSGGDLFLEPTASYQVAQALAGSERLPVSQQTLHHRLRESGLLVSLDKSRKTRRDSSRLRGPCPRAALAARRSRQGFLKSRHGLASEDPPRLSPSIPSTAC